MAYIYKYQFKNLETRKNINLIQFEKDIKSVITKIFSLNLKEVSVYKNHFEFKLYSTVHKTILQKMGIMLKQSIFFNIDKSGFIRMPHKFYAIIYPKEFSDNQKIYIELIDSMLIDHADEYIKKANKYFKNNNTESSTIEKSDFQNKLSMLYYIDVVQSYIDIEVFIKTFGNLKEKSCYLIEGYHRRLDEEKQVRKNLLLLEKCYDVEYIKTKNEINLKDDKQLDFLEIHNIKPKNEKLPDIHNKLNLTLPHIDNKEKSNKISKDLESAINKSDLYINFTTYNVGQGLATSLSHTNNIPFFYFDYGIACGRNKKTKPIKVNMPTNRDTMIFISHNHMDHWYGITENINSFKSKWILTNQNKNITLTKKIAEIFVEGGTVSILQQNIYFKYGAITNGGISKLKKSRLAKNNHETGLTFRLETSDLNILVAGDQLYDYISDSQLKDLDILVASHHGGSYKWSKSDIPPNPKNHNSIIIYSYGAGNSYNHPSECQDYINVGWKKEHHTIHGNFKVKLKL